MAAFKSKLETFRDWMISQGHSDLWASDETVLEVINKNPKGKFKDYLKALKEIGDSYEKTPEVSDLSPETEPTVTVTQPSVSNSLGENTMNEESQSTNHNSPEELMLSEGNGELKQMLNAFEAQVSLQAMINNGNVVDKSAAQIVSRSTSWASRNPKTAVAVGAATVVAAGIGVYHMAKIAKTYI